MEQIMEEYGISILLLIVGRTVLKILQFIMNFI